MPKRDSLLFPMLLLFLFAAPIAANAAPLGHGFTYQGQLKNAGSVVNGTADFQFQLYDAAVGGALIAGPVTVLNVHDGGDLAVRAIDPYRTHRSARPGK